MKINFTSHEDLYHFIRMPFSLKNVLAVIQSMIYVISSTVKFRCSLLYWVDTVVLSKTAKHNNEHKSLV